MTDDEKKKLDDIHAYLFSIDTNEETRAKRIDRMLFAVRAGAWAGRGVLWIAGFIGAIATAIAAMKGWLTFEVKG